MTCDNQVTSENQGELFKKTDKVAQFQSLRQFAQITF